MIELHTCNYFCEKPACIKAQRDEMRDALFDQHTVAALQQKLAASEPVAWYDLDQMTVYTPVKPTIPGTWTPLYAAPPRTYNDGLEAAELIARLRSEATAWDAAHTHTGPLLAKLLYRAADDLAAANQRITDLTENGQRLIEAADGWKTSAQHFQKERNELEAQLERQITQNNRDAERFRECLAENAALREDAERYRWFRLQGLWDSEHFPWPDGFEYPEGISEDDGAMLDAAIDAAGKK